MNALLGLAVLVVWPLVQVPLLLYLARRAEFDADDGPDPREYVPTVRADDGSRDGTGDPTEDGPGTGTPEGVTVCHRCGAENGPSYDYCQNCVARLAMDGPYSAPA